MSDVAPGWYDDGGGAMRWWDGSAWTEHVADTGGAASDGSASASTAVASVETAGAVAAVRSARDTVYGAINTSFDLANLPDTLWAATSVGLTGLQGGHCRVTADFLYVESGTFSTQAHQVKTAQIVNVEASQSMTQKARGVGSIMVTTNGTPPRLEIKDIQGFREGVTIINKVALAARERTRLRDLDEKLQLNHQQQTLNINRGEQTQSMTPRIAAEIAAQTAQSAGVNLNEEIERLVSLRERGALTDDEFSAAKRKLLGL